MNHREASLSSGDAGAVQELCEATLDASVDQIFIFDSDGRYLYANPARAQALGRERSEIIGKPWRDLGFSTASKECFGPDQERVFATGQLIRKRTSLPTPSGQRDCEYVIKPLRTADGEVTAAVCVVREVAPKYPPSEPGGPEQCGNTTEPDLHIVIDSEVPLGDNARSGEGPLHLVADELPVLISYIDADERYRFNNHDYAQWFGYRPEEINGKTVREILGDSAYGLIQPYMQAALLGKPVSFEQAIPRKNRGTSTVRASYMPDRSQDGSVRGFFAVVSDLGEPIEVADKSQPDQDLTQLAHVSRLNALGKMASEILHEISQPLTAIASYSEACLRVIGSPPVDTGTLVPWLEDINAQAGRARALVRRMRSFARKGEPHRVIVDLNQVVRDVAEMSRLDRKAKRIRLAIRPAQASCLVLGDELLLQQVVLNVLRNAVDAVTQTVESSGEITVSTEAQPGHVEVTIRDTGPGVPEESRAKVFEPFFTSRPDGVGVGLTISHAIIEAHGGQLTVTDNPGGGACFRFTLPRYQP